MPPDVQPSSELFPRLAGIIQLPAAHLHAGSMDTEGPFVKVPIECVNQVFRKTRKTVSEKRTEKSGGILL